MRAKQTLARGRKVRESSLCEYITHPSQAAFREGPGSIFTYGILEPVYINHSTNNFNSKIFCVHSLMFALYLSIFHFLVNDSHVSFPCHETHADPGTNVFPSALPPLVENPLT